MRVNVDHCLYTRHVTVLKSLNDNRIVDQSNRMYSDVGIDFNERIG